MTLEELLKKEEIPKDIKLSKSDIRKLIIKYKGLLKEFNRNEAFWKSTNKNLEHVTLQLKDAYKILRENQQRMLAIEKMASLGRITANIAHEMNTPLAAIKLTLLELESLVSEYMQSIGNKNVTIYNHKEIANDMNKSINIIKKAIDHVISFVKGIKAQTRELTPKDHHLFNIIPTIQDVLLLLNYNLHENNCSVNFKTADDNMKLYGSEGRLAQIITNLLTNAIDAYKWKNGGIITMELTYSKSDIVLTVKDKGCGIKKENLSKIYDPLFTTKGFTTGTGLGLTIVRDIITTDFDGEIDVKSEVDKGTTFTLYFKNTKKSKKVI